jgi:carbon-monoxide dehydrogenase medium subunit
MYQPITLAEASRLLRENGPGGRYLAGGTDLVIAMKEKGLLPKYIVDLKRVPGLTGIRENKDKSISIGALTTMYELEMSPLIKKKFPFLAQSCAEVGSIQIRNRATLGGNMANATPSADTAPALIALNATVRVASAAGDWTIPVQDFFRGPGQNAMNADEILTEITIPKTTANLVGEYIKFSPREMMVLEWMKQGKTNWEISRIIGVSERTVRFHVESIFMKLDVGSRTQAVAFAIENGLFPSL